MLVIRRRPATLLIGVALLGAAAGCNRDAKAKAAPPPLPDVVVAEVEQRAVAIEREYTARTEASPTVEIRARISGVLEQVLFKEGTEARQGQVLFVLQREEYQAALDTARAQLAKAQADLTRARDVSVIDRARAHLAQRQADLEKARADVARYRPLAEARAIPQQDLDTSLSAEKVAVAAVDAAAAHDEVGGHEVGQVGALIVGPAGEAAVVGAKLNLDYTTIRTPITGIIGKVMVDQGNLVGKAEPTLLATVSSVDPIYVDFSIPEADYLRLASRIRLDPTGRPRGEQTPLDLFLIGDQPLPHKGFIVFVERAVDVKTGTIAVRAVFPNPDKVIRPGQFARVRGVVEQRPEAVLVPEIALQEQQGAKVALVVEAGDKVAFRSVTVDERIGDLYVVKSGLKPGERVIVEGVQKVRPGMQVKPVTRSAAKAGA